MKRIARVFPRKTSMTPRDDLVFFGPPTLEAFAADIDEVHISVTFTWDLEKAEQLYYDWQMLGVPVELAGRRSMTAWAISRRACICGKA